MVVKLMDHESGCNTEAYNPEAHKDKNGNVICYGSTGALQLSCEFYKKGQDKYNVSLTLALSYQLYVDSGYSFKKWSTCKLIAGCK